MSSQCREEAHTLSANLQQHGSINYCVASAVQKVRAALSRALRPLQLAEAGSHMVSNPARRRSRLRMLLLLTIRPLVRQCVRFTCICVMSAQTASPACLITTLCV